LYWRIVLGLAACITGVLAVQTVAVLVLLSKVPDGPRLSEFTRAVAADLGTALEADPNLDVQHYIDTKYASPLASLYIGLYAARESSFVVPIARPRRASSGSGILGAASCGDARQLGDRTVPYDTTARPWNAGGRCRRRGSAIVGTAGGLEDGRHRHRAVAGGTGLAGRFIFGSVRRRLSDLEQAARRVAPVISARTPESQGLTNWRRSPPHSTAWRPISEPAMSS
jgi:hypothetical protein